jgi:hypothetical protein
MAPKANRAQPQIQSLRVSGVTEAVLADMFRRGQIAADKAHSPKDGETSAHPEKDEVVVFHDIFTVGLHFPLDIVFVETLRLHNMFVHQLTPNSIARVLTQELAGMIIKHVCAHRPLNRVNKLSDRRTNKSS